MMTKHESKSKQLAQKSFVMNPLTGAIISALAAPMAMAQEQAQNQEAYEDLAIEEVIVTATKREVSIQEVAQSITTFSTAKIARMNLKGMENLVAAIPSISMTSSRPGLNELVYRGISTGDNWYSDSQVAVYLDDQPMTASTTQLDPRMVDIERIESLPGPQGTLFGSSSQTGTLRIITNKPDPTQFSGRGMVELATTKGGDPSYDFNGHLNIPVVEDKFAIRLVGYYVEEGGYIDNVASPAIHATCAPGATCNVGGDGHLTATVMDNFDIAKDNFNTNEIYGGRLSGLWNITDNWNAFATLMTQSSESEGVWESDQGLGDYKIARFSEEWRKDDWWSAALTVKGDLGFAELSNSMAYSDRDQSYQWDNVNYEAWHTSYLGIYYGKYYYDYYEYYDLFDTGYLGGQEHSVQHAKRFSNEFRLTSQGDSRFEWMAGAFYEKVEDGWFDTADIPGFPTTRAFSFANWQACEFNAEGYDYIPCPLTPSDVWYQNDFDREISQLAFFGELGYQLNDKWHFTVGARWFEYDRYTVNDYQWPPGLPILDGVETGSAEIQDGKESDQVYKFNARYFIDDDRMLYFTFSQGFRLGGKNGIKSVRSGVIPEYFDADNLDNYEIGLKSEWFDNRLQINASLFYMLWDDIQMTIRVPDQWWIRGQVNGGGGENFGGELDVTWQATANLRLTGNFYNGDPKYTDDYETLDGNIQLSAGRSMPNSAKRKFALAADYTIPRVFENSDMFLRLDYQYMGPLYSDSEVAESGVYDVDSFSMVNFQAGLEMANDWSLTLMVRNLLDERGNTYTSSGQSGRYAPYWGAEGYGDYHNLARPRTVSLRVAKRF
jgi:iron complex outermembrane receptor protein